MVNGSETLLFRWEKVSITTRKVVIGVKSYEISTIRSVRLVKKSIQPFTARILVLVSFTGLLLGILSCLAALFIPSVSLIGFLSDIPLINVRFLVAVLGLLLIVLWPVGLDAAKPTYMVQIETDANKVNILRSKDQAYSQRIQDAIQKALAHQNSDVRSVILGSLARFVRTDSLKQWELIHLIWPM